MLLPEDPRSRPERGVPIEELLAHGRFLRDMARALTRDDDAASELVQETWVQVLESPPRHGQNVRAWLALVLRRASWRRRQNHARHTASTSRELVEPSSPSELLAGADVRAAVAEELAALSEPLRDVVRLRFFDSLPPRDIARELGVPVNTVNSRLQRALARLRARLDQRLGSGAWIATLLALAHLRDGAARPIAATPSSRGGRESSPDGIAVRSVAPRAAAVLFAVGAVAISLPWRGTSAADGTDRTEGTLADDRSAAFGSSASEGIGDAPALAASSPAFAPEESRREPLSAPRPPFVPLDLRVVDPNGVGAGGARVFAIAEDAQRLELGTTDEHGRLRVELDERLFSPPTGSIFDDRAALKALHSAWATSDVYYVLRTSETLELSLGPAPVELRGRVRDASGAPVANAAIDVGRFPDIRMEGSTLVAKGRVLSRTDGEGNFAFTRVPPGPHPVYVASSGFAPALAHASGRTGEVLEVVLDRGARIEGTVRDADGAPVAGARVWAGCEEGLFEPEPVTCDGEGRYSLVAVNAGRTHLFACDPARPNQVDTRKAVLVPSVTEVWDPILSASPGLVLELVDESGAPLAGWLVNVASADGDWRVSAKADGAGRIVRHSVPAGPLTVQVVRSATRLVPASWARRVVEGREPTRIVVPAERPNVKIAGVLDASRLGTDLDPRVFLRLADDVLEIEVGVDPVSGRFEAAHLGAGTWVLRAAFAELGSLALGSVELEEGEARDLGVLLAPDVSHLDLLWSLRPDERLVIRHVIGDKLHTAAELASLPVAPIAVVPGELIVTRYGGSDVASWRMRVAPGSLLTLDLDAP